MPAAVYKLSAPSLQAHPPHRLGKVGGASTGLWLQEGKALALLLPFEALGVQ